MNNKEFEQFVLDNGKEILRFCRMTCADREAGDELHQDTMLKLLSKMRSLDLGQNVRSYALSVSILLWKNKRKKYANRNRLIPMESMDRLEAEGNLEIAGLSEASPENCILMEDERIVVQQVVARLPEKYRIALARWAFPRRSAAISLIIKENKSRYNSGEGENPYYERKTICEPQRIGVDLSFCAANQISQSGDR